MSNKVVEGFGTYGTTPGPDPRPAGGGALPAAIISAMESGPWAEVGLQGGAAFLGPLPWDPANADLYFSTYGTFRSGGSTGTRRILPATQSQIMVSMFYAHSYTLPNVNGGMEIMRWSDAGNNPICALVLQSTGALALYKGDYSSILGQTQGPVIVLQSAVHMESYLDLTNHNFTLNVNGVAQITLSGMSITGPVAQLSFMSMPSNLSGPNVGIPWIGHLVIRDTSGTHNNTFPIGERKVATLPVNSDDLAHQGWTGHPLLRFGTGILDLTAGNGTGTAVTAAASTQTDLGSADFTLEGNFRFLALPTGANKAVFFGKWDEPNNRRSYEFYLGGPALEGGNLVFRTSTDGQSGTVSEVISWPWVPATGTWYHLAIVRASAQTLLFINGVQQGLPIADARTYFAGAALSVLGGEYTTSSGGLVVANTSFNGWQDEFRLTVGFARYLANFTPPAAAFPRGGGDAHFAQVGWLSGWDNGIGDDGPNGRILTTQGGAAMLTPNDGLFNYQTMNKIAPPLDNTFDQAALIPAQGTLTQSAIPADGSVARAGTKDGTNAANYRWVTALANPTNGTLTQTVAGALAATNYFVRSTWVNATGETLGATETSLSVSINNVLNVAPPPSPPAGATGWNVYVSTTTGTETKQNGGTPIALGTPWVEPTTGLVAGAALPGSNNTGLKAAYDVLTGATIATTMQHLVDAINAGPGSGSEYGTGTVANFDVFATLLPSNQVQVTANVPGTAGNSIVTTTTDPNGSWGGGTLSGGANLPPYSQFGFSKPPNNTTVIDSITLMRRTWKTDAGPATVQSSLVGTLGTVVAGAATPISTVPTIYFDLYEQDPETGANLTPTSITGGKFKIDRTV